MGRCFSTIIHACGCEILFLVAIHESPGEQPLLPYAGGSNLKRLRHSVWTSRWSFGPESIGEHPCAVATITADDASVLAVVSLAYLLVEHLILT